ncbi:Translin N-terminal protein [Dioscorea alata]|uniref:Translin N-terminal protein n=2 Tax=Dioscorea alata TaxID=55571 RepID=A0ACB7W422_DIOAL|nr:Translin N-terminal protein [Dioscorea alata]
MGGEKGGAAVDNECAGHGGDEKQEFLGVKLRKRLTLGWKGGPCTPVPNWKLEPGPSYATAVALSARKLGANLWEMQGLSQSPLMSRRGGKASRRKDMELVDDVPDLPAVSIRRSAGSPRRRASNASIEHHKLIESIRAMQSGSPASCSSMEVVTPFSQPLSPGSSLDFKERLQDSGCSLKTSTELLKVLNWIWRREEQHESNVSLVKELKLELQHARTRIQELMQDQQLYRNEMDDMVKQVAENKLFRKNKEQDRLKDMMQSVSNELEDEKRLRRRSESLHRKLGKELSQVKLAFAESVEDLERQRKTNILLENLCDEFAKGIREYEQELRALKQKAKGDSDHKFDRLVLHMSDAWLDERLQMAQENGDINGKGSITDRLRGEIKNFFRARQACNNAIAHQKDGRKESNLRRRSLESVCLNKTVSAPQVGVTDDGSTSSDLHCFELNMNMNESAKHDQSNHRSEIADISESLWQKDTKSRNVNKMQLIEKKLLKSSSYTAPEIGAGANQIELVMSENFEKYHLKEAGLHDKTMDNSMKNSSECSDGCKVHPYDDHAEESRNHLYWRGHFVPVGVGDAATDVHTAFSPVKQWDHRHASSELEISQCSSELLPGVKKNGLKAKLLEARLKGKHSRLK